MTPLDPNDPDFRAFVNKVRVNGITDPIIITLDGYIISGHRRFAAAKIIGLKTAPCRTANLYHDDPRCLKLLRDCNGQRNKPLDEMLREEVVSANPEEAHWALREYREQQAQVDVDTLPLEAAKRRARITKAKRPSLWPLEVANASLSLVGERRKRTTEAKGTTFLGLLQSLPLALDDETASRAWHADAFLRPKRILAW